MENWETLRVLQTSGPRCEEVKSETYRLEGWLDTYLCTSLSDAINAAASFIRQAITSTPHTLFSLRIGEGSDAGYTLQVLSRKRKLHFLLHSHNIPNAPQRTDTKERNLLKETEELRIYSIKSLVLKLYRQIDISTLNKALAEAVSMLVLSPVNGALLVDMHVNPENKNLGLFLRISEKSLEDEIAQRRLKNERYLEAELKKCGLDLITTLCAAKSWVSSKQGILHEQLNADCIYNQGVHYVVAGHLGITVAKCEAYTSPERRISLKDSAEKADVFSLGTVLMYMARLWLPMDFETCNIGLLADIIHRNIHHLNYSPGFKALLRSMLDINPATRVSMKDVLRMLNSDNPPRHYSEERNFRFSSEVLPAQALTPTYERVQASESQLRAQLLEMQERATVLELIPVYTALFGLYCERQDKYQAEEIATHAIIRYSWIEGSHSPHIFQQYKAFIEIAMMLGLNRLAYILAMNAMSKVDPQQTGDLAYCYKQLAILATRLGTVMEARNFALQWLSTVETDAPETPEILMMIATACCLDDCYGEAVDFASEALALREQIFGKKHPDLLPILSLLANAAQNLGDYDSCRVYQQRIFAIKEISTPAPNLLDFYRSFVKVWVNSQAYSEAESLLQVIAALEAFNSSGVDLYSAASDADTLYKAENFYPLRLEGNNEIVLEQLQLHLNELITLRQEEGKTHEIEQHCRKYMRVVEEIGGERSQQAVNAYAYLSAVAESLGLHSLAKEYSVKHRVAQDSPVS